MDSITPAAAASALFARLFASKTTAKKWPAAILAGTIAPAAFVASVSAADLPIPPNQTINGDTGVPVFAEGLIEGFLDGGDNETGVNPGNSSPELGLRMATINQTPGPTPPPDVWADNRTWVYTGQMFTGPNGIISWAFNDDDNDWLKLNNVVVLNDNGWDTTRAGVTTGFTPNTWIDFEFRVGNGGGGAGPSGGGTQGGGSNWSGTIGAVFSHDDELSSLNALDYTFGTTGNSNTGYEIANGTPELFRFFQGNGFTDDLVSLGGSPGTLTIDGTAGTVVEASLRFTNPGARTLTINDGTGSHKTLLIGGLTQWATTDANADVTLNGTADLRPTQMTDNGFTVKVTQAGTGSLILDSSTANTTGNTTFAVTNGTLVVSGSASNPIPGSPLRIEGTAGTLRFGGSVTYNNTVTATAAGTLAKTDGGTSTVSGAVAMGATPLNVNVTNGTLSLTGAVTGNGFVKNGAGTFQTSTAFTNMPGVTVNAGTYRSTGASSFSAPTVTGGVFEGTAATTITANTTLTITGGEFRTTGSNALTFANSGGSTGADLLISGGALTVGGTLSIASSGSLFDVSGGTVTTNGTASIRTANVSGGLVRTNGSASVLALNLSGGRFEADGSLSVSAAPNVTAGGTLALRSAVGNSINNVVLGTPLSVSGGTYEIVPGALPDVGGFDPKPISLAGGILALDTQHGLNAHIYNANPTNTNNFNPDFGPEALAPGNGDFSLYTALFNGLDSNGGITRVNAPTTLGGRTQLNFPDTQGAPYGSLGANFNDNVQARIEGQFYAQVAGTYEFGTTSDDGSIIFIDGVSVVYNNRYQGETRRNGTVTLSAGFHSIEIGHYEGGGGAGLTVDVTKPGSANQILNNADLFLTNTVPTFDNVITATASGGTVNVIAPRAIAESVIVPTGTVFGGSGNRLTINALDLTGAGSRTFNIANETTVLQETDAGAAVTIVKSGTGDLVFDEPAVAQFTNAGSTINITQGAIGLLLGAAINPIGNAQLQFNGGGVILSSKTGSNISFTTPNFANGGVLGARVIGSGLPGTVGTPIQVTMNGALNVGAGNTVTLSTADFYELNLSGTASGSGTAAISRGVINSNSNTALQGLNILMNPLSGGDPAILKMTTNSPTVKSLATTGGGTSQIIVGNGLAPATLTLTGPDSPNVTRFNGAITENNSQPVTLNANGSGTLVLGGPSTFTGGVMVSATGTLELAHNQGAGTGAITLNGGTLQFAAPGLLAAGLDAKFYNSDPNATGAYNSGVLNSTLANVLAHYAAIGTPAVTTTTAANGNTGLSYNPDGDGDAPFLIHGFTAADNIEALFTGKFDAGTGGTFLFQPRSDDGTTVYINGNLLVDNNRGQGIGEGQSQYDRSVTLGPGLHDILITFNEGGGGAGMFVDFTPLGSPRRLLTNGTLNTSELFSSTNAVIVPVSSTINLRGGLVHLGALTQLAGTTITTTAGMVTFTGATLPTAGSYTLNGPATTVLGQITDSGNNVTINQNGGGTLILGDPAVAQLTGTSVINVSSTSSLVAVGGTNNPMGNASVSLASGSALKLSSTVGGNVDFTNTVSVLGNASIAAGNFGGGAADGPATTTLTSGIAVGAGNTLSTSSSNNYTLAFTGNLAGPGNLAVTGGNVSTSSVGLTGSGAVSATAGTLAATGTLSANSITVSPGAVVQATTAAVTATAGTTVNSGGVFGLSDSTYSGGNITLNGGLLRVGGTSPVDLSTKTVSVSNTTTPGLLRGRLYTPVPGGGVNNDTINLLLAATPNFTSQLTGALDFGPVYNGDAKIAAHFGTVPADTVSFTAAWTGKFTAAETGALNLNGFENDDDMAFWVDLNQNGIFETGANELVVSGGCCDGNVNGSRNLVAGESYRVAFVIRDGGGGGSIGARFSTPSILQTLVNPGANPGLWSDDSTNAILVDAGADLSLGTLSLAGNAVAVVGGDGDLSITGAINSPTANLTKVLAGTLELSGALTLDTLTASGGTTYVESSSTLTALNISDGATVVLGTAPPSPGFEAPALPEAAGQAAVPEPGSVGLLLVGALGLLARRRRE